MCSSTIPVKCRAELEGQSPALAARFEPDSFGGPVPDPRYRELPDQISGDVNRGRPPHHKR
jgi:hypothetical protein